LAIEGRGVVVYPDKNNSVHELLRYADTAMYQVKEKYLRF
jgi:GGDEF domain-containing protein